MSLLAVTSDPGAWILFAGLTGGAGGFFCCALFAARRVRDERSEGYWEGYGACNRAHHYAQFGPSFAAVDKAEMKTLRAAYPHDSHDSHSSHSEEMGAIGMMGSMGEYLKRP